MARCTSAAATAESTPPDSPQMAWPSPTCSRIAPTCSSTMLSMVQDGRQPGQLEEPAQDARTVLGVHDLGMELDAEQAPVRALYRGDRRGLGLRSHREAGRGRGGGIAVGHPHVLVPGRPGQEGAVVGLERRGAVLRGAGLLDRAAEAGHHQLEAVADAEDRHPGVEQAVRGGRRAVGVDRRGAAGQDDRLRLLGQHLRHRHRGGDDLGVDVALAYPAGDQLRVLRAEIDDEDGVKATWHADHLSLARGIRV